MKKREPDLMWIDAFDKQAKREGWSLFEVAVGRCEIMKCDRDTKFKSDAEACYFAYQAALRHEPHARAAFTLSLRSQKKLYHPEGL